MILFGTCIGCGTYTPTQFFKVLKHDLVFDNGGGYSFATHDFPTLITAGGLVSRLTYRLAWPTTAGKNFFLALNFGLSLQMTDVAIALSAGLNAAEFRFDNSYPIQFTNTTPVTPFSMGPERVYYIGPGNPGYLASMYAGPFSSVPYPTQWDAFPDHIVNLKFGGFDYYAFCFLRSELTLATFHGEEFLVTPATTAIIYRADVCNGAGTNPNLTITSRQDIIDATGQGTFQSLVESRVRILIECQQTANPQP